jgi:hypothetical protein
MAQLDQAAKELESEIQAVEKETDNLRTLFEMYFQGIERQPPTQKRDALKRRVMNLRTTTVRNTELRFRINQLVAKFSSYDTYWNRVLRQMEEGTYHRDVAKARYRAKLRSETEQAEEDKPERPASRPARSPAANLSDENVNAIYNAYVMAKRRCKENTKGLTREALAKSLRKQVPSIQKQYGCKKVEFKVVIKGGKAVLKAVPK